MQTLFEDIFLRYDLADFRLDPACTLAVALENAVSGRIDKFPGTELIQIIMVPRGLDPIRDAILVLRAPDPDA